MAGKKLGGLGGSMEIIVYIFLLLYGRREKEATPFASDPVF